MHVKQEGRKDGWEGCFLVRMKAVRPTDSVITADFQSRMASCIAGPSPRGCVIASLSEGNITLQLLRMPACMHLLKEAG